MKLQLLQKRISSFPRLKNAKCAALDSVKYRNTYIRNATIVLPIKKSEEFQMKAIDKIIGYANIKGELCQISDTLKNYEFYEKLGVTAPRGLLLYGEPGVGKSLMATAIIEESGRRAFICRKDKPNGDFVKHIKDTFDKAAESAPSIVYLDDMDKFTNGDERHPDAEEYVTVQSCIDEVKGKGVFVLATVNNIRNLPHSLYRPGRFDRTIKVEAPHGRDAERIIAHYLKDKKLVEDIDHKTIARIMDGRSCAELETVINEAGLYAGYERAEYITMNHFMEACMRTIFKVAASSADDYIKDDTSATDKCASAYSHIIWHEAGHAVVSEVLCPGSVTIVSAYSRAGTPGGFTAYYNERNTAPLYWSKSRITGSLAGMAAIEQKLGFFDIGNSTDLDQAFEEATDLVVRNCICGLHLHKTVYEESSPTLRVMQEQAVSAEIEKHYRKAKEILAANSEFLDKIAAALNEKKLLIMSDIQAIKATCTIIPATL